jgi:hypothetical protein
MTEGACQQAIATIFNLFTIAVERTDDDGCRALGGSPFTRQGEAALVLLLFAAIRDDAGVDEFEHIALLYFNDHYAAEYAYLHGSKAATIGAAHGIGHIIEQAMDARGDFSDRAADLAQGGVALF